MALHEDDDPRMASDAEILNEDQVREFQSIIARGVDTVVDGECGSCCRKYDHPSDKGMTRCPSDDCPSHWEEAGIAFEGH